MNTLATLFVRLIDQLLHVIAWRPDQKPLVRREVAHLPPDAEAMERHRARMAPFELACTRLRRMATRFTRLFARFQAGTLPAPRPSRAGQASTRIRAPIPRLPTHPFWLINAVHEPIIPIRDAVARLLVHPDMAEFLAAAPQARRIVNPLCRMLALKPPPVAPKPPTDPQHPAPPSSAPITPATGTRAPDAPIALAPPAIFATS